MAIQAGRQRLGGGRIMERIGGICIIVLLCLLIICMLVFTIMLYVGIRYLKKNIINWKNLSEKNVIEVNVTFSPLVIEEKRILGTERKNPAGLHEAVEEDIRKDNRSIDLSDQLAKMEDIVQLNQTEPESRKQEDFSIIDKIILGFNEVIAENGYAVWIGDKGKRIGIGDKPQEIGDKVVLKLGSGNIRVWTYEDKWVGLPGKAQWKECDFRSGAYYECYHIPEGIDSNFDYEIIKIVKCAILTLEDDTFHVVRKGSIEVRKL